jgi:hypothetical protein
MSGLRVVLTSNFPRAGNEAVAAIVHRECADGGWAWLSPRAGAHRFEDARRELASYGLGDVVALSSGLADSSAAGRALILSGGEPIGYREEVLQAQAHRWWPQRAPSSGLVVAASGGAMLLTLNVSSFRLLTCNVETVVNERDAYPALEWVPFEVLPHANRQTPSFVEKVARYAAPTGARVWCHPDGAAVSWSAAVGTEPVGGAYLLDTLGLDDASGEH